jgi:hypothetical protein
MRSDLFQLRSRARSFGFSRPPLNGECLRTALRFNIEEIVPNELEDRFPKEFGRLNLPRILRLAMKNATHLELRPTVS